MKIVNVFIISIILFCSFQTSEAIENKREMKKEIKILKKEIKNKNNLEENFFKLGNIYYKLNRNNDASFCYKAVTLINPKHYSANLYLGDIELYKNKNLDYANTYYSRAIKINPQNSEAYYGRSIVYSYIADYENALKDIDKVLEITPNDEYIKNKKEYYLYQKDYYNNSF